MALLEALALAVPVALSPTDGQLIGVDAASAGLGCMRRGYRAVTALAGDEGWNELKGRDPPAYSGPVQEGLCGEPVRSCSRKRVGNRSRRIPLGHLELTDCASEKTHQNRLNVPLRSCPWKRQPDHVRLPLAQRKGYWTRRATR